MSMLSGDRASPAWQSRSVPRLYEDIRDPDERTRPGWFLGLALTRFGDMAVAEELTERTLAESRALDDRWGIAAALVTRSTQGYVRGDFVSARRHGEESLALFREVGDRWGQSQAMGVLGRLAEIAGDYPRARAWHQDGLRIAEGLRLWTEASTRWSELGRIALLTGDLAEAEKFHEQGRRLAVEQGDKPPRSSRRWGWPSSRGGKDGTTRR